MKRLPRNLLDNLPNKGSPLAQVTLRPRWLWFDNSSLGFLSRIDVLASPSPSNSEGILQEVRRAMTYVTLVESDDQTGAFCLFFRHCADDDVVVVGDVVSVDVRSFREGDLNFRSR